MADLSPDEHYAQLLLTVQDVWGGQYQVDQFRRVLRANLSALRDPRECPPRDEDLQKIKERVVKLDAYHPPVTIPDENAERDILHFSRALNLNELECVRIFAKIKPTRSRQEIMNQAFALYFKKRNNLLVALLDLIRMYNDSEFPDDIKLIVDEFVAELFKGKLVFNLVDLLLDLLKRNEKDIIAHNNVEIWHVLQVLWSIAECHVLSVAETREVLRALKETARTLTDQQDRQRMDSKAPDEKRSARSFFCYMLLMVLMKAFDLRVEEEKEREATSGLSSRFTSSWSSSHTQHQEAFKKFHLELSKECHTGWVPGSETFQAMFRLIWSLFLRRIGADNETVDSLRQSALAPSLKLFEKLAQDFLSSKRLSNCQQRTEIAFTLASMLNKAIHELSLLRWCGAAVQAEQRSEASNFSYLLLCLALCCELSPDASVELVQGENNLLARGGYLEEGPSAFESYPSRSREAFIRLLEALCKQKNLVDVVANFLKDWKIQNWNSMEKSLEWALTQVASNDRSSRQAILNADSEESLACILRLIKAVRKRKISQKESLPLLFRMLGSPFSTGLKAHILDTISTLAEKQPAVAMEVWRLIEEAQVLPTKPSVPTRAVGTNNVRAPGGYSNYIFNAPRLTYYQNENISNRRVGYELLGKEQRAAQSGQGQNGNQGVQDNNSEKLQGILYDLEFVEQSQQSYPLTLAFSKLILTLICAPANPAHLGYDYRDPGILPYLEFVFKHVFLKLLHSSREFRRPEEMWQLAEASLAIFCRVMEDFDLDQEWQLASGAGKKAPPPPTVADGHGFGMQNAHIMANRPNERTSSASSERPRESAGAYLLKNLLELESFSQQLFSLIQKAQDEFSAAGEALEQASYVESALTLCLRLLHEGFEKQTAFLALLRLQTHLRTSAVRLSERLTNPKVMLSILVAVGNLPPRWPTQVQMLMSASERAGDEIDEVDSASSMAFYAGSVILHLTLEGEAMVPLTAVIEKYNAAGLVIPAFAAQLKHAELPATGNVPDERNRARLVVLEILLRNLNCPHVEKNLALLLLGFTECGQLRTDLNQGAEANARRVCLHTLLDMAQKPRFLQTFPSLGEITLRLLYRLCNHPVASKLFLTYMANRHEAFFFKLRLCLPPLSQANGGVNMPSFLIQRAWVMQILALELHVMGGRRDYDLDYGLRQLGFLPPLAAVSGLAGPAAAAAQLSVQDNQPMQMLSMLDAIGSVNVQPNPDPMPAILGGQKTSSFKMRDPSRPWMFQYHVKRLYLQATRCKSPAEATALARQALQWNYQNLLLSGCYKAIEGWRQLLEIVLYRQYFSPDEPHVYLDVCFQLLKAVLKRLTTERRVWLVVAETVSRVALTLVAKIREQTPLVAPSPALRRQVLELAVEAITIQTHHLTRAHLYAIVFNFLRYLSGLEALDEVSGPGRRVGEDRPEELFTLMQKRGSRLLEVVCHDILDSRVRLRSMSFVFLTSLIAHSPAFWLDQLRRQGALTHILGHLKGSSAGALRQAVISLQLQGYEYILMYESLFAFLLQIAATERGSLDLVQVDMVQLLSRAPFLSKPSWSGWEKDSLNAVSLSPMQRHLQLLLPALQLTQAMMVSLPEHLPLRQAALHFTVTHRSTLRSVLSDHAKYFQPESLRAVELVSGLYWQLYQSIQKLPQMAVSNKLRDAVVKDEGLLFSLLKTCLHHLEQKGQSTWLSQSSNASEEEDMGETEKQMDQVLNTCNNVYGICCARMMEGGVPGFSGSPPILFNPSMQKGTYDTSGEGEVELGVLVGLLQHVLSRTNRHLSTYRSVQRELQALPSKSRSEVKYLWGTFLKLRLPTGWEKGGGARWQQQLKKMALQRLRQEQVTYQSKLDVCFQLLERGFWILFHHCRYFYQNKNNTLRVRTAQKFQHECNSTLSPLVDALGIFLLEADPSKSSASSLPRPAQVADEEQSPAGGSGGGGSGGGRAGVTYPGVFTETRAEEEGSSMLDGNSGALLPVPPVPLRSGGKGRSYGHSVLFLETLRRRFKQLVDGVAT